MATPKQTLWAHIREFHPRWKVAHPRPGVNTTLVELVRWHAIQHHRFHINHIHEGVNLGAGNRPVGWRTGEGVVAK